MINHPKPERYSVFLGKDREVDQEIWVSYNTKLDNIDRMPSAYSQAIHTASRHAAEVFAGYANGDLISVKTYRK
jgi:hypothetical protein